jgi:hypothetical protein
MAASEILQMHLKQGLLTQEEYALKARQMGLSPGEPKSAMMLN